MIKGQKKNILIISERFFPEEFLINDLVSQLKKDGYTFSILTQSPSYPFDEIFSGYKNKLFSKDSYQDIRIYRFKTILGYKTSRIKKILNYLNFIFCSTLVTLSIIRKFDGIFVYHTGPLTQAFPAAFIKLFSKKKFSIWTQDVWPDTVYAYGLSRDGIPAFILEKFVKFIYWRSDNIFISSPGFRKIIENYTKKPENIHYVPQWVPDIDTFKNCDITKNTNDHYFSFTFAGNIGEAQNLKNVVIAFSKVTQNYNNAIFNIYGDGSEYDTIKTLVSKNNISNVILHGRIPSKDIPTIYEKSNVLLISLKDHSIFNLTIPAKFQNYLAANKPVLCVMEGTVPEIVKKYNLGLVASPDNLESIEHAFIKFLQSDKSQLKAYTERNSFILSEDYNRKKSINKIANKIFN